VPGVKLIEILAEAGSADTVASIVEQHHAIDFHPGTVGEDGRQDMRFLVHDDRAQAVLDALQNIFGTQANARIMVLPVEVVVPKLPEQEGRQEDKASLTREALYETVVKGTRLDMNFVTLAALSTVVAVLGLMEDNVAVVIGAMVIAPLLGPNLALALASVLGDMALLRETLVTNVTGLALTIALAAAIGAVLPVDLGSGEVMTRTDAGMEAVALALASGAAATLSLTTGLSSVLVGVMVAVALLPPAAVFGLMLGSGHMELAGGAALLLAVNVVCVNLAAKVVFMIKGVRPRTWWEREKARRAMALHIAAWVVALLVLVAAIAARHALDG